MSVESNPLLQNFVNLAKFVKQEFPGQEFSTVSRYDILGKIPRYEYCPYILRYPNESCTRFTRFAPSASLGLPCCYPLISTVPDRKRRELIRAISSAKRLRNGSLLPSGYDLDPKRGRYDIDEIASRYADQGFAAQFDADKGR